MAVDIFQCLADIAIVTFFVIELYGARDDRDLRKKQIEVAEKQLAALNEQKEVLEESVAELAEINDQQAEILNEGQDEPDSNREYVRREAS